MATMTYREALNLALSEEMRRDGRDFVTGNGLGSRYADGMPQRLLDEFDPRRVVHTHIAESGFTGVGIGAAMVGLRPVVELMTFDFVTQALDQIDSGLGLVGLHSEIASFIGEQALDDLDARVERVVEADAPTPDAKNLEHLKTPTHEKIVAAVRRVCHANGN